ncbi:hypothetical protein C8J57DRAFT_1312441 [Mycena rebaudengoi]|nr:hypothetical protein C8J57DRAFT_1312441 [Mycena rebaudengoi]
MMTRYGMPYILEDTTGKLGGRLHLTVRCTASDPCHTSYMIYSTHPSGFKSAIPKALVGLDFGPHNTLGTISFSSVAMSMRKYLAKPTPRGSSKLRRFVASDGQQYQWARRVQPNQEWTSPGEPEYSNSSGCILEIAEQFGGLAPEMLASLWIMRHIAAYALA